MRIIVTIFALMASLFVFACGGGNENRDDAVSGVDETDSGIEGSRPMVEEGISAPVDPPTETKYFSDESGYITEDEIAGRFHKREVYDESGNLLSESFFDENGEPCCGRYGFNDNIHRYEFTYNESGKNTSEASYGINGEPVGSIVTGGIHRWEHEYDDDGRVLFERRIYANGRRIVEEYDSEGYLISERHYDSGGELSEELIYEGDERRKCWNYDE